MDVTCNIVGDYDYPDIIIVQLLAVQKLLVFFWQIFGQLSI